MVFVFFGVYANVEFRTQPNLSMNILCNECKTIINDDDPQIVIEGDNAFCNAKCKSAFDEDVALFNQQQQAFVIFATETELSHIHP